MKSSIEHDKIRPTISNENNPIINIKNSINLGDLIKKINTKPKKRKQQVQLEQGQPGAPDQAGQPGEIYQLPNQPMTRGAIPQEIPQELTTELNNAYTNYENTRTMAEVNGVSIPKELKSIQSSIIANPNNPTEIRGVIDELYNDTQNIFNLLPNSTGVSPQYSTGVSPQYSLSSNSTGVSPQYSLSSNSTGVSPQYSISSNSTGVNNPSVRFPKGLLQLRPPTIQEEDDPEYDRLMKMKDELMNIKPQLQILEPETEMEKRLNELIKEKPYTEKLLVKPLKPRKGKQLTQQEFLINQLRAKGRNPPRNTPIEDLQNEFNKILYRELNPLPITPIKPISQQLDESLSPNILNKQKKGGFVDNIYENSKSFLNDVRNTGFGSNNTVGINSNNIPRQTSLLDTITQPKPERNLLGQGFSAFSDFLRSSKNTRDASSYGGLALGAVQPELLPIIGALETGNQALNIIENPINSIEQRIQQSIDRPKSQTYRTDSYGQRYDKITNKPIP